MRLYWFSKWSRKGDLQMQKGKEQLSKRLARLRIEKGLTAKAMARLIGVPESTYREWEYGRGLRLPPLGEISQVLAISVTELVTGEKPNWPGHLDELELIEQQLRAMRLKLGSLI
jgi:transcriptional regulator with XRE-family HTH domain